MLTYDELLAERDRLYLEVRRLSALKEPSSMLGQLVKAHDVDESTETVSMASRNRLLRVINYYDSVSIEVLARRLGYTTRSMYFLINSLIKQELVTQQSPVSKGLTPKSVIRINDAGRSKL